MGTREGIPDPGSPPGLRYAGAPPVLRCAWETTECAELAANDPRTGRLGAGRMMARVGLTYADERPGRSRGSEEDEGGVAFDGISVVGGGGA